MTRRDFTRTLAALPLAAVPLPQVVAAGTSRRSHIDTVGLQLWTVRRQLAVDAAATLRAVQEAGYSQVELMRVQDARDLRPHVDALGLSITSAFVDWKSLLTPDAAQTAPVAESLALAREINLKYLVFGYIGRGERETIAQMRGQVARINDFGRMCRDAGIQLCYHHHSFEFAPLDDGVTTAWHLLEHELHPDDVKFEIDTFWLALGGMDVLATMRALGGRVVQLHLKDLRAGQPVIWDEAQVPPAAFKELGEGIIDFPAVLDLAVAIGVEQCHVEQDESPAPLDSIATSHRYLRSLT